ncbi:MAG: thiamine-phosphate kinase [Sulfuricaulis sp.]|uniref:thiamine-phosphate kinase n=1 Tax=Sulfuricaulis sp. TaxID=2003553 RepID=UPI0025E6AC08|nr:thiamine-phosphate kinase [Sulfuricaulis sp.]MCR4345616.1 thiamine-phosphate kinase [Sulfuricaulis sp.]
MTEFELIHNFFTRQDVSRPDVVAGIGDDAALLQPPAGQLLAVTSDLLVSGVHFLPDVDPFTLGHKALAVNLSDLAAMGTEPAWFLLNLTLPKADARWLEPFCRGMFQLAKEHNVQLVGGDTSRGPLAIAIEAHGFVPAGKALRRSGAKAGDGIYITGTLGDAALALRSRLGGIRLSEHELGVVAERLDRPTPRVREGMALRGIAHSAIDISDGLLADLGHILKMSQVGAQIRLDKIPVSPTSRPHLRETGWDMVLASGDDYELCFTSPEKNRAALEKLAPACGFHRIGVIEAEPGLRIVDEAGKPYQPRETGHNHFA